MGEGVLCALRRVGGRGKVGGGPPRAPLREHAGVPLGAGKRPSQGVLVPSSPFRDQGYREPEQAAVGRRQPRKVVSILQQFILP